MSAKIVQHPAAAAAAIWPGFAAIDATGATLARDMLEELESGFDEDISPADLISLENWPRQGQPFRNIVAEYAARAHAAGPEPLTAFYAVLSDFVALVAGGTVPDACFYDRFCAAEETAS